MIESDSTFATCALFKSSSQETDPSIIESNPNCAAASFLFASVVVVVIVVDKQSLCVQPCGYIA